MSRNTIQLTVALTLLVVQGGNLSFATSDSALGTRKPSAQSTAVNPSNSEMRDVIESYTTDRGNLSRTYSETLTPARRARFRQFYEQWRDALSKLDFNAMSPDGRIDYLLFRNHLNYQLLQL